MAERNARDDMFDKRIAEYFDEPCEIDFPDSEVIGERPRYVLVEENRRGCAPRYAVSHFEDLLDAGRTHVNQECAEDWRIVEAVDLDTGATYDGDIESTVTWTETQPPPPEPPPWTDLLDTKADIRKALLVDAARQVRAIVPEAAGVGGTVYMSDVGWARRYDVQAILVRRHACDTVFEHRSPEEWADKDLPLLLEDIESDVLDSLAELDPDIGTEILFPPL